MMTITRRLLPSVCLPKQVHASAWLSRRWLSSPPPYKVLGVRRTATTDQIKAAFRKLAKQHHPDLRNHNELANNDGDDIQMSDIVAAYETLMDADFGGGNDSRVAIACEVMTLDDLKRNREQYSVYAIQVFFMTEEDNRTNDATTVEVIQHDERVSRIQQGRAAQDDNDERNPPQIDSNMLAINDDSYENHIYPIVVHPDDSVTDVKHALQQQYGSEWSLDQHRYDRHGLATAWEVVVQRDPLESSISNDDDNTSKRTNELIILGNHWFLYTYNVSHGDLVHVVVRNNDDD